MADVESLLALRSNCAYCAARPNGLCGALGNGEAFNDLRDARRAMRFDGTCTGEHGVGLHKMGYLGEEHGADTVEIMRKIKRALDPNNILNPGKVVGF